LSSDEQTSAPFRIVISYRRQDATGEAHRLRDSLVRRFGRESVFLDIDSIPPGADWRETIHGIVTGADVLLALIGHNWLTVADEDGRRRLDDVDDVLRFELETALREQVRIIPLQLHGAELPGADDLPKSLVPLVGAQSLRIDADRWRTDVQRLVRALDVLRQGKAPALQEHAGESAEDELEEEPAPTPAAVVQEVAVVREVPRPPERPDRAGERPDERWARVMRAVGLKDDQLRHLQEVFRHFGSRDDFVFGLWSILSDWGSIEPTRERGSSRLRRAIGTPDVGVLVFVRRNPPSIIVAQEATGWNTTPWDNSERGEFRRMWILDSADIVRITKGPPLGDDVATALGERTVAFAIRTKGGAMVFGVREAVADEVAHAIRSIGVDVAAE
jgi:hypothetical protein